MRNLTETNLTAAVLAKLESATDPRFKQIMTSLIKHLHAFVREVNLTEEEWFAGIQFLTATGGGKARKIIGNWLIGQRAVDAQSPRVDQVLMVYLIKTAETLLKPETKALVEKVAAALMKHTTLDMEDVLRITRRSLAG